MAKGFFRFIAAVIFLYRLPVQALPTDDPFDFFKTEMAYSTGFFKTESRKAPGYVTTIGHSRIQNSSARSLHELLEQYVPGVNMSYHFFGSLIGQRGIQIDANPKTAFLLDGKNLNTRHHFGYMTAMDVPLLGNLKTIEVVNGPGAIVHGSGAINGFINMIPKSGKDHLGFSLANEYGPVERLTKTEMQYGQSYGQGDIYLYFGALQAKGFKPNTDVKALDRAGKSAAVQTEIQNIQDLIDGGGYRAKSYVDDNYKFNLNWNQGRFNLLTEFLNINTISLSANPAFYQEREIKTGPAAGTAIPFAEQTMSTVWGQTHLVVRPKYNLELSDTDEIEAVTSLFLVDNANYDFNRDKFIENFAHNQTSEAEYFGEGIYKTTRWSGHSFAAGGSVSRRDFYHRDPIFRNQLDPAEGSSNVAFVGVAGQGKYFHWTEYAAFMEDVVDMTPRLRGSIGLRYDAVRYGTQSLIGTIDGLGTIGTIRLQEDSIEHYSPRVALAFQKNDSESYKFSYQHGFRHPDLTNHTAKAPDASFTVEEEMDSFEANYSRKFEKRINLDVNAFYNILKNTIGWRSLSGANNTPQQQALEGFTNTPETYASGGGEVILGYKGSRTEGNISYSYARPFQYSSTLQNSKFGSVMEVNADRDAFARFPEHMIKMDLSRYFLSKKQLLVHTSVAYTSALHSRIDATAQSSYKGGRTQLDLMGKYDFQNGAYLKMVVKNLLADQHTRPAWTVERNYGTLGWDERMYYLEMGIKL